MNSYVEMTMVKKEQGQDDSIISVNKAYFHITSQHKFLTISSTYVG